jgi:hypothetical protein
MAFVKFLVMMGDAVARIEIGCGVDEIDRYKVGDKSNRVWVLQALKMGMGSFVRS